ncbi:hypothetical protein D7X25_25890 [bacterium 1XD42-8]|nr:hypothetical protein D7X25_25890 [bacterium 1XD42-8]
MSFPYTDEKPEITLNKILISQLFFNYKVFSLAYSCKSENTISRKVGISNFLKLKADTFKVYPYT